METDNQSSEIKDKIAEVKAKVEHLLKMNFVLGTMNQQLITFILSLPEDINELEPCVKELKKFVKNINK